MGELLHRAIADHFQPAIDWLEDLLDCDFATLERLIKLVRLRNFRAPEVNKRVAAEAVTELPETTPAFRIFRQLFWRMYGQEPFLALAAP